MRKLRAAVIVALLVKVIVLAVWWQGVTPAEAEGEAQPAKGAPSDSGVSPDLFQKSRGFRDLLEAVHERNAALDERESTLASREAAMKALEKTLADEITRLEGLSNGGAAAPGAPAAAEGAATAAPTLPKIYASMKPEEAGPILDRLDDATAKGILARMKDRQVGALLAAMNRDRAVALTKALGLPAAR
jgi:flagellar motility protein MotE (MotC chaperone)